MYLNQLYFLWGKKNLWETQISSLGALGCGTFSAVFGSTSAFNFFYTNTGIINMQIPWKIYLDTKKQYLIVYPYNTFCIVRGIIVCNLGFLPEELHNLFSIPNTGQQDNQLDKYCLIYSQKYTWFRQQLTAFRWYSNLALTWGIKYTYIYRDIC